MPARLILVRHGHVGGNTLSEGRMNGWTDVPLSPLGWRQVNAFQERMRSEPAAVACYSSPLQRAADTARALIALPCGPPRLLDDLKEIHCGEVDGWPAAVTRQHYPDLWEANLRQEDDDLRWPGGESYREFRERTLSGVRRIAAAHPGERVVVVTHAGVISQLMGVLHGLRPAAWEQFRPGNCSITELEWADGSGRPIRFDDRSHLEELDGAPQDGRRPPGG